MVYFIFLNKYLTKALPNEPVPPVINMVPFIYRLFWSSFFEQISLQVKIVKKLSGEMVGNVGYAPTTPRMSIEYSTIELIPHVLDPRLSHT